MSNGSVSASPRSGLGGGNPQGRTLLGFGATTTASAFPPRAPRASRSPATSIDSPKLDNDAILAVATKDVGESDGAQSSPPKTEDVDDSQGHSRNEVDMTKWQSQLVAEMESRQRQVEAQRTHTPSPETNAVSTELLERPQFGQGGKDQSGVASQLIAQNSDDRQTNVIERQSNLDSHTPLELSHRSASSGGGVATPPMSGPISSQTEAESVEDSMPTVSPLRIRRSRRDESAASTSSSSMARQASGSEALSPRKQSRRGYVLEEDEDFGRPPRNPLPMSTEVSSPDPSSTKSDRDEEVVESSEVTPARKKRGILLSSHTSPGSSFGRRSRRLGAPTTSSVGSSIAGDVSSLHSHDASNASEKGSHRASLSRDDPKICSSFEATSITDQPEITFPSSTSESGSIIMSDPAAFGTPGHTDDEGAFDSQKSAIHTANFHSDMLADSRLESPQAEMEEFHDDPSFANGSSEAVGDNRVQSRTSAISQHPYSPSLPIHRRTGEGSSAKSLSRDSTPVTQSETLAEAARKRAAILRQQEREREREEWEGHILAADWEELEVARFLNEFGKHVYHVRSIGPLDQHHQSLSQSLFPSTYDWTEYSTSGEPVKFNRLGYSLAWFTALLTYISPNRMVDLQGGQPLGDEGEASAAAATAQTAEEFRWQALKANGERFYLSAVPLYEMLGSRLRKTWRWESKVRTFISFLMYSFLWWRGLLLASGIFATIMLVLTLKTFPPKPDTLREILARQRRREEERRTSKYHIQHENSDIRAAINTPESTGEKWAAASMATSVANVADSLATKISPAPPPSRYSLVAEITRKYGLQASLLAGALADGHERAKNFALWRSPRATWRLLLWLSIAFFITLGVLTPVVIVRAPGLIFGIFFFIIAPIAEYRPHWLGVEWNNPFDWIFAGVPNDAQYSLEILRERAAKNKPLISDPALLLLPDDRHFLTTTRQEGGGEEDENLDVGAVTASAAPKGNKINWSKWSDRMLKGKSMAIRGSEMLAGSRTISIPRLPINEASSSAGFKSMLLTNLSKGVNFGLDTLESKSAQGAAATSMGSQTGVDGDLQDSADVDGTYWCIYDNCCGHLVITPQTITFRSLFAKRPRGRRGIHNTSVSSFETDSATTPSSSTISLDQPILDPLTGELTIPASELEKQPPKIKELIQIPLTQVRGLKKLDNRFLPQGSRWNSAPASGGQGLKVIYKKVDSTSTTAKNKSVMGEVDFWQVVKRNEAFNRLVALVPQEWEKVC